MPRLYVLSGPEIGRSFLIDDGHLLGRARDCQVTLRGPSVSRHHARIERAGAGWALVDLGSRNGMYVYGRRVERAPLADYGSFRLGKLELRFRLDERDETAEAGAPAGAPAGNGRATTTAGTRSRSGRRFVEPAPGEEVVLEENLDLAAEGTPSTGPRPVSILRSRGGKRTGLLAADLTQRPWWIQAAAVGGVVVLALGAAWATYALVTGLRGAG